MRRDRTSAKRSADFGEGQRPRRHPPTARAPPGPSIRPLLPQLRLAPAVLVLSVVTALGPPAVCGCSGASLGPSFASWLSGDWALAFVPKRPRTLVPSRAHKEPPKHEGRPSAVAPY